MECLEFFVFVFFVMCLVIPVFPTSLNCPFVIAPLVSLAYVKYSMHNVQDYSALYDNAVRPVVSEGSHLENTFDSRNSSLRRKSWAHEIK